MNTQKINNGSTPKGGKDNTKVVLTAAGAATVGAVAGAAFTNLQDGEERSEDIAEKPEKDPQEDPATSEKEVDTTVTAKNDSDAENDTQPTPIATDNNTNSGTANNGGTNTNTNNGGSSTNNGGNSTNEDVEAEALAVAERLVDTNEIDPNDIDAIANIQFEDAETIYTDDGSEIPVAAIVTPDGGQYFIADLNGDKVYDVVYNHSGDPVAGVQAGLSTSDAEMALNEREGYLEPNANDPVIDDDPTDDIIALDETTHPDNPMEEIEDDEILADIFEEDTETVEGTYSDAVIEDGLAMDSDTSPEEDLVET